MRFPRAVALAVVVVLLAASLAATLSHVLIDFLGDFVLAHDTYDRIDHRSREMMVGAILTAFGCVLALVGAALYGDARGARGTGRAIVQRASRLCTPATTSVATIVLATVAVVAMEDADLARIGDASGNIAVALGGSLLLGLVVTTLVGASIGCITSLLLRSCARAYATLARAMRRLILAIRNVRSVSQLLANTVSHRIARRRRTIVRRAAKRGPPLAVSRA